MNTSQPPSSFVSHQPFSWWFIVFGVWFLVLTALASLLILFYLGLAIGGAMLFILFPAWLTTALGLLLLLGAYFRTRLRWLFTPNALNLYLYSTLGLISLLVLFYSIERWRGHRAWASVQYELRQSGQHLNPVGAPPAGLNDQNNFYAAPPVARLFAITNSNHTHESDPNTSDKPGLLRLNLPNPEQLTAWSRQKFVDLEGVDRSRQIQGAAPGKEESVSPATSVLRALNTHRDLLNQVREATSRPYAWPYPSYPQFYHDESAHFILQRVFCLRASIGLAEGHTAEPLRDIKAGFKLADYAWHLPYPRIAEYFLLIQPIWDGCALHRWNSQDLALLENILRQVDILSHYPSALRKHLFFDMALLNHIFPIMSPYPAAQNVFGNLEGDDETAIRLLRWIYPKGWAYQNQAALYRLYQEHRDDLDQARNSQGLAGYRIQPELPSIDPFFATFIAPRVFESCQASLVEAVFAQTAIDLARIGCALERFRLDHGRWPDGLETLQPGYLGEMPKDLMSGSPFRYQLQPSGHFVLYSVGWNGEDDGGKGGLPEKELIYDSYYRLRDIVWALP